jgi:hypothetical protein
MGARMVKAALLWGMAWGLGPCALPLAPGEDAGIARIKAVYLYHFASFAEWPEAAAPQAEVLLCVVGDSAVGAELRRLDGQDIGDGRLLKIIPVPHEALAGQCRMAYLGADAAQDRLLAQLRGLPLLSVSDQPGFARQGGMIELYLQDDKVRMRINLGAVRAAGLKLSSKLLRLADIVEAP